LTINKPFYQLQKKHVMAKSKKNREFNFEVSELLIKCETTLVVALRDKDQLLEVGFTNEKRLAFQAQLDALKLVSTDDFMLGMQMTRTQEKEAARQAVEKSLRTVLVIAENLYGATSGKFRQFGGANLGILSDDQLIRYGRNAAATATALLAELQPEGVTPAMITAITTKIATFDTAVNNQVTAIRQRDITTDDRTTKANELYRTLAKVCTLGKNIWYGVNEAKYNDYIIYDGPTGDATKAANPEITGILAGTVADNQTNAAIAGASLALNGTQLTATSDEYGEFSIDNIPQGTYTLNVSAAGYQPVVRTNIVIKADEQAEVSLRMGKG
jgi:hypothetical protein